MRRRPIRVRLLLMVGGAVTALLLLMLATIDVIVDRETTRVADVLLQRFTESQAKLIDDRIEHTALRASLLAVTLSEETSRAAAAHYLSDLLRLEPHLHGVVVAFAAGGARGGTGDALPPAAAVLMCAKRGTHGVEVTTSGADCSSEAWYQRGSEIAERQHDAGAWLPADAAGGVVSCAVPMWRGKTLLGVVRVDVALGEIAAILRARDVVHDGFKFLVQRDGVLLTFPDPAMEMRPLSSFDAELWRRLQADEGMASVLHARDPWRGEAADIFQALLPATGARLVVVVSQERLKWHGLGVRTLVVTVGLVGLGLLLVLIRAVAGSIARPIATLAEAARRVTRDGLDQEIPALATGDEVEDLSAAMRAMMAEIKRQVAEVERTTADKERIAADLRIAAEIQRSMLPRVYPAFPEHAEVDVYGLMAPAREIGGDLYDHFMVDEHRLAVAIGDVSGKGAPAALFMALTSAFLRATAKHGHQPARCLERINAGLLPTNDNMLFVTMFYAVIDLRSGETAFVNAGHNPPWLVRADGRLEKIEGMGGVALGLRADARYSEGQTKLGPGDRLVLYTDGVTEAFSASREMFGASRLEAFLAERREDDAAALCDGLLGSVKTFAGGAPQSDDITVLVMDWFGSMPRPRRALCLKMKSDLSELARVLALLTAFASERGLADEVAREASQRLEDLLTRVVLHAFPDGGTHYLDLRVTIDGGSLVVVTSYDGIALDPGACGYERASDRNHATLRVGTTG